MVLEIDTVEDLDKKIKNEEQKIERTLTLQERTNKKKAEREAAVKKWYKVFSGKDMIQEDYDLFEEMWQEADAGWGIKSFVYGVYPERWIKKQKWTEMIASGGV